MQLLDRSRHSSVIGAISAGGHSGLLSQLIHSAVAEVAHSPHAPEKASSETPGTQQGASSSAAAPAQHSVEFVDALLSLVGALVASASGCTALSEAGVIPALMPLISDSTAAHIRLVSATVWPTSVMHVMPCHHHFAQAPAVRIGCMHQGQVLNSLIFHVHDHDLPDAMPVSLASSAPMHGCVAVSLETWSSFLHVTRLALEQLSRAELHCPAA